jgi:hypothetical protein
MATSADSSSRSVDPDAEVLVEAWRQFAQEDAAITAPPELERRVLNAWEALQHPPRRSHRPSPRSLFWPVGVVAAGLLLAVALRSDRATTVPSAPTSDMASSVRREVGGGHRAPRPLGAASVITFAVDPVLETETLQLVRVRMPRLALQAVGVVVSGSNAEGFVDVDVVVGEDGLPRDVRRVAPIYK